MKYIKYIKTIHSIYVDYAAAPLAVCNSCPCQEDHVPKSDQNAPATCRVAFRVQIVVCYLSVTH